MKFIIGFLIAVGLLIFVFVLIFRGGSSNQPSKAPVKLSDYANTSVEMQFTIEGPVSADQTHNELQITVGNTQTTVDTFQGYQGTLLQTKSYANNSAAYTDFLKALQLAGYLNGNSDKSVADERGYCATGRRYVMGIVNGSDTKQRFWYSSCGVGTFKGKTSIVENLFEAQVPDYEDISNTVF